MIVLVINCGSTSIKAAVLDHEDGVQIASLHIERLGEPEGSARIDDGESFVCAGEHAAALEETLPKLVEAVGEDVEIAGVGHRVVHGGEAFEAPTRIDDEVLETLEEISALAPLHNPNNIAGIRAARKLFSDVEHVAVFDTAFHATLPNRARQYALPGELVEKHGLRRYGFHGPSHSYVAQQAAEYLGEDIRQLRIITCHLGGGCSMAAVEYGRSIETSMGMTPLEGLVMGTRSGDVDPGVLIELMRREDLDVEELDDILNRKSGLAGLSGVGADMRDIEERAADGDERCRSAIQVFCHRVRKYIGAYAAVMGGVDAIVFTAGIGQNSVTVRHRIAQRLDFLGARLDEDRNREARVDADSPVAEISDERSRVRLFAVRTDEQHAIARETARLVEEQDRATETERTIPIAISARHCHLTQETIEALFGEGHELTERNPLSQPGQFAAEETVTLVGPKRTIEGVRILGPARDYNQVEIARTDEFHLGVDAPVRRSGDVANSPGIKLVGTEGREVQLEEGVICAWRHIHMTPEDAEEFGVSDGDVVDVAVDTGGRDLVFGDTLVRVKSSYKLEMHVDTDEGNAAELPRRAEGVLVSTDAGASIARHHPERLGG